MGTRRSNESGKFYQKQITHLRELFVKLVSQPASITKDTYITLCEQVGVEPDPNRMPLDYSDFSVEVQVAFFMFNLLEDSYAGLDGTWVGKNWGNIEFYLNTYGVEDKSTTVIIMKLYEEVLLEVLSEKRKAEAAKAERAASQAGGKNYTHKVQG